MTRVLVIGLDGATFDVLLPLAKEGRLPVVSKLLSEGTSAPLESIYPPITAAAWASFMTGKNPLQHQFFHWLDPDDAQQDDEMQDLLGRFFRAVDDGIQQLLRYADDETLVVIISDHGFGRLRGFIHLNNWLLEKGYLRLRRDPLTQIRHVAHRPGYTPENIYQLTKRLGLDMRRRMNRGRVFSFTNAVGFYVVC